MQEIHLPNSFFDDADSSVGFDFIPITPSHQKDLKSSPQINSALIFSHSSDKAPKAAVFSLHRHLLVYHDSSNPNKPIQVLEIASARLENISFSKSSPNYGFKLTRNGMIIEFYSPKKQIIESWFSHLRKICVLLSFHDDYHAKKPIGKGGFAKVYLIESKSNTKHLFAAKNFHKDSLKASTKEKAKPALLNEIDLMRRLNHDKIVKLYEVHETDNSVYLVLELIKGKTLYDTLKKPYFKRNLSPIRINEILYSILTALEHIGSRGIMHRDLKPANILIEKSKDVKIADFGLATLVHIDQYLFKKCGTPGYMAPEVFKYNEQLPSTAYNEKCDLFSIGCIFYYMLFGHSFFNGYDPSEVTELNKAFNMNSSTVSNIRKEIVNPTSTIDKEALSLLLRLIEADPSKRISASEALAHRYFNSATIQKLRKCSSTDSGTSPISKATQSELLSPLTTKNNNNNKNNLMDTSLHDENSAIDSYIAPGLHQYTQKDSLFLDVARSKSNGNESLTNLSGPATLIIRDDNNGGSTNSLSAFGVASSGHSRSLSKIITQNRSPRNASPFLKAAIINSIHQKNDRTTTDIQKKPKAPRIKFGRHNTDYILIRDMPMDDGNDEDEMSVPEESLELDGKASECSQIQKNFDHIKSLSRAKLPSIQAHLKNKH